MSMKHLLLGVFLLLAVWTVVTVALIPTATVGDKTPLIWTTDPNPQRTPQVDWFNKLYPDCFLRIDPNNRETMKVIVQSSAGMGPDLIDAVGEWNYQTYHSAGILWDVTEKAPEMGFGPETLPESVRPLIFIKEVRDGKIVERQYIYPCNVFHVYMFFNKNIFDEHNIEYPPEDLTWELYLDIANKLTIYDKPGDHIPTIFGAAGASTEIILWEMGGRIMNDDGTRCLLNSEEAVNALQFNHDLLYKYNVEPTETTNP